MYIQAPSGAVSRDFTKYCIFHDLHGKIENSSSRWYIYILAPTGRRWYIFILVYSGRNVGDFLHMFSWPKKEE
jgi:hypothetical protein